MYRARLVLLTLLTLGIASCGSDHDGDVIYQVARLDALEAGQFEGTVSYRTLAQLGDFGLGTFDALDGEMVYLDAEFYQVRIDGVPSVVDPTAATAPFANVTRFDADQLETIEQPMTCAELEAHVDTVLGDLDGYYAIRIDAAFESVTTRSVPAQEPPFPPLSEVVAVQSEFELTDVNGTMVGFRFPDEVEGLNVTGFHFHFLTDARDGGGHLLDCRIRSGTIAVDRSSRIELISP